MIVTRRAALLGLVWAGAAAAEVRPRARPVTEAAALVRPLARPDLAALVRAAGLEGLASVALVEIGTGTLLAAHDAATARPPASVAKALTALYALEALGEGHRFATRVLAAGPVRDGVLEGDLVLAGGGDPVLTTDALLGLARAVAATGLREVRGGVLGWGGALPGLREIDPGQLPQLGYNPAVGGLNLNFNRVHFEWAREGAGYRVGLEARGDAASPVVTTATVRVVDRAAPVYTYAAEGGVDAWTVARGQLGEGGSRWLPVRSPALYAAQAFRALLRDAGVVAGEAGVTGAAEGEEVARVQSAPLTEIVRDLLLYSTNLTAEVVGLAASRARGLSPVTLAESARAMSRFIGDETGARVRLVDHSGLGGESRVAASEMALALASRGTMGRLGPLLRGIALTDAGGEPLADPPGTVRAKTGSLNFVSTLAGYVRGRAGRDMAFAIFAADPERRAAAADDEVPAGSRDFNARARRLQQVLLQLWARTL